MPMKLHDEQYQATHCIGNGRVCAYGIGPDIIQLFGPTYSTPTACSLHLTSGANGFESRRHPGTDIWVHTLFEGQEVRGTIQDTVLESRPVFLRRIKASIPVSICLTGECARGIFPLPEGLLSVGGYMGEIPEGSPIYSYGMIDGVPRGFFSDRVQYLGVLTLGDIQEIYHTDRSVEWRLTQGDLLFVFGQRHEEVLEQMHSLVHLDLENLIMERAETSRVSARLRESRLTQTQLHYRDIVDDIAVLIKAQQSITGGVLAGHAYHLAYVRDNYGVHRGLLSMGCFEEDKCLLQFYAQVFDKYGQIHNAQGTDTRAFHIHENDDTEITGYLALMGPEYYEATGDSSVFSFMRPLTLWCMERQHWNLKKGMLPFNGDETYIAGGLLPRSAINHGSMEATALYHTACRRMIQYADELKLDQKIRDMLTKDMQTIRSNFVDNFMSDGKLYCNQPSYYEAGGEPMLRIGVRACGHGMGLCVRNQWGEYVCHHCYQKWEHAVEPREKKQRYQTASALLMPMFVGADLIDAEIIQREMERMALSMCSGVKEKIVGYDYGLMVYALRDNKDEICMDLLNRLLEQRDDAGAWVEYYLNGVPCGTMCRPWESAINIAGIMEFWRKHSIE